MQRPRRRGWTAVSRMTVRISLVRVPDRLWDRATRRPHPFGEVHTPRSQQGDSSFAHSWAWVSQTPTPWSASSWKPGWDRSSVGRVCAQLCHFRPSGWCSVSEELLTARPFLAEFVRCSMPAWTYLTTGRLTRSSACWTRCPASTRFADLSSISFAGSPPRLRQSRRAAGLHQSGSWGRQTPG